MTSTFTITLRGASVACLLQEMAALLCGDLGMSSLGMSSLGMSMAAASAGSFSLLGRLSSRFDTALSPRSMLLPLNRLAPVATNQLQRPECVVNRPADAGEYGFIGHIIDWLKNERTKIRSGDCWHSATVS
jgi:hypothetical protein